MHYKLVLLRLDVNLRLLDIQEKVWSCTGRSLWWVHRHSPYARRRSRPSGKSSQEAALVYCLLLEHLHVHVGTCTVHVCIYIYVSYHRNQPLCLYLVYDVVCLTSLLFRHRTRHRDVVLYSWRLGQSVFDLRHDCLPRDCASIVTVNDGYNDIQIIYECDVTHGISPMTFRDGVPRRRRRWLACSSPCTRWRNTRDVAAEWEDPLQDNTNTRPMVVVYSQLYTVVSVTFWLI